MIKSKFQKLLEQYSKSDSGLPLSILIHKMEGRNLLAINISKFMPLGRVFRHFTLANINNLNKTEIVNLADLFIGSTLVEGAEGVESYTFVLDVQAVESCEKSPIQLVLERAKYKCYADVQQSSKNFGNLLFQAESKEAAIIRILKATNDSEKEFILKHIDNIKESCRGHEQWHDSFFVVPGVMFSEP